MCANYYIELLGFSPFKSFSILVQIDYAAGYGYAAMNWVQLFFVCELGENIQVQTIFIV